MSALPVIVLGAGGHATVLIDALRLQGTQVLGVTAPSADFSELLGHPVLGDDAAIARYTPAECELVLGVGSVSQSSVRRSIFERFKSQGYRFAAVVHPSTVIAGDVALGEGVQIMAGAVVQSGSRIGANTIVNTHASVDHDCRIGAHCHVAPGVVLSGDVSVGEQSHLGTGAVAIQGVRVGTHCLVGAGALLLRDVPDHSKITGVWK